MTKTAVIDRFELTNEQLTALHREELAAAAAGVEGWLQKMDAVAPLHEAHRQEWEARKHHVNKQAELDERKARYEENQPYCEDCNAPIPYSGKRGRAPKRCEECREAV